MNAFEDVITAAAQWLSAVVLALVALVYRSLSKRIEDIESHNGETVKEQHIAMQRLYDKVEALRLETKQDQREARADIIQRIEGLSKQMDARDSLATRLVESLRSGSP